MGRTPASDPAFLRYQPMMVAKRQSDSVGIPVGSAVMLVVGNMWLFWYACQRYPWQERDGLLR